MGWMVFQCCANALAVAAVPLLCRCDKLLDAAMEESERQSGKTPL